MLGKGSKAGSTTTPFSLPLVDSFTRASLGSGVHHCPPPLSFWLLFDHGLCSWPSDFDLVSRCLLRVHQGPLLRSIAGTSIRLILVPARLFLSLVYSQNFCLFFCFGFTVEWVLFIVFVGVPDAGLGQACVRACLRALGLQLSGRFLAPFFFPSSALLLTVRWHASSLLPCSASCVFMVCRVNALTSFSFLLLGRCVGSGGLRVLHDISPCASCRNFFQVRSGASAAAAAIASLAGCLPVRRDRKEKRERRRRNKHRWAHWSRATVQPAAPRKIPSPPPPPSLSPLTIPTKAASFSFFLLSFFHAAPAPHRWALHAALDRSFYTRPAGGRRRRRRQRGEPVTRRSASIPPSSLTAAGAVAVGGYALRLVASSH